MVTTRPTPLWAILGAVGCMTSTAYDDVAPTDAYSIPGILTVEEEIRTMVGGADSRMYEEPEDTDTGAVMAPMGGSPSPTFLMNIHPMMEMRCNYCHTNTPGRSPPGGLITDLPPILSYRQLVDTPAMENFGFLDRIEPNQPTQSYLFLKVTGQHLTKGGMGSQMPLTGALSAVEIEMIREWILAGAPF